MQVEAKPQMKKPSKWRQKRAKIKVRSTYPNKVDILKAETSDTGSWPVMMVYDMVKIGLYEQMTTRWYRGYRDCSCAT
eukprot:157351-Amorphochlora_amoeboformis.AAC.1